MSRFLLTSDYSSIIQTVDLNQITENTAQNLYDAETKAISRMRTKLVQRYMVDIELGSMEAYSDTTHYRTKDRILDVVDNIYSVKLFDVYVNTTAYVIGDIVTDEDGYVYTSIADSTDKELTNTSYWTPMIGEDPTDAPSSLGLWEHATAYVVDDIVYNDEGDYFISIQNGTNKVLTNTAYWTPVTVTINSDYWQLKDNRYPMFVEIAMDLALYNLYARINPRNIPDLRKERNREALDQLDAWASGTDTAEVLNINIADQVGLSIRYGSAATKQNNFF